MSKADEMLEDLGYEKYEGYHYIDYIRGKGKGKRHIFLDKEFQTANINDYSSEKIITKEFSNEYEREAVTLKFQELGWLDETHY